MSTPQGWYDDGSGRQRWWDGAQWTDQFAAASTPDATSTVAPVTTKKRVGVLGWIALGITVVGAIVSWIPWIMGFGWILLFVGLVLSIVTLFLKGAKWPGIVGIVLAVVAGVVSGIVLLTIFLGYSAQHPGEFGIGTSPVATPDAASEPSTAPSSATERPSAQEVADGFLVIMDAAGVADKYTPEQALCVGQHLVDSDVSTESLINVAHGKDIQSDATERTLIAQVTAQAVSTCLAAP